ncbi:MAG TPA: hypothetical protein VG871_04155, partial [Vicinamibacterales bacterium]|nr:hypothetical protein [Vicinamibacterales bacterium]
MSNSHSDRRGFLLTGSATLAAALAACRARSTPAAQSPATSPTPGAPPAFNTAPAVGPPVSAGTFTEAGKLAQFEMTEAERAQAAGSWQTSMAPLLERRVGPRKVALEATLAPATQWRPETVRLKADPTHRDPTDAGAGSAGVGSG